jgi:hypothetical protein
LTCPVPTVPLALGFPSGPQEIEGALSEETLTRVPKWDLSVSTVIPVKTPKRILKIILYDKRSDTIASTLEGLR